MWCCSSTAPSSGWTGSSWWSGEEVLESIVERSLRRETGARGIDSVFIQILEEAAFEAYSRPKTRLVEISQGPDGVRYRVA
jgi:ATP-dependent protease Clp ATPase subunit